MATVTLWLLISLNAASNASTSGHLVVIERFPTAQDCEHVLRNLPGRQNSGAARCIQATVVKP